jgi:hypothetical protein
MNDLVTGSGPLVLAAEIEVYQPEGLALAATRNLIANPTMAGAIAGTPGTAPTGWFITGTLFGVTRSILGSGVEDGVPYVDVAYSGTATAVINERFEPPRVLVAPGQRVAGAILVRLIEGSLAGLTVSARIQRWLVDMFNGVLANSTIVPTSAPLRQQQQHLNGVQTAGSDRIDVSASVFIPSGATVAFALRIGYPQAEFVTLPTARVTPIGPATPSLGEPWGVLPTGTLTPDPAPIIDYTLLRASDAGYVTRETDPGGLHIYPPILASGLEIDRAMDLAPGGQGAAAGWGSIRLANDAGALNPLTLGRNADGRPVRLRIGRKTPTAQGWRDPPRAETATILSGIGAGWQIDETELRLALRDPTYWLERPIDGEAYAGTGGLHGTAPLAGKRKPRLRGGTPANPVREIAPLLVDPIAGIYQVSDAPGGIVTLNERGLAGGIFFHGSVADITAAAPPAGTYAVESSARGLFLRLGSFPPAGQITVDAWGAFPDGSTPGAAASVAL